MCTVTDLSNMVTINKFMKICDFVQFIRKYQSIALLMKLPLAILSNIFL